jgi:hypothetical protein
MLVNTMTDEEVTKEIYSDYEEIYQKRTIDRLVEGYEKQRRKFKIAKTEEYPITQEFKSHRKNPWIMIMRKSVKSEKYNSVMDTSYELVTYYYTSKGLRVFSYLEDNSIAVYNGHVFSRYRLRMGLEIEPIIDVVKHFFCKTYNVVFEYFEEDNPNSMFMGLTNEGYLFGTKKDSVRWIIIKTFVNKDTATLNQFEKEQDLKIIKDFFFVHIKAQERKQKFYQDMLGLFSENFVFVNGKVVPKDYDENKIDLVGSKVIKRGFI